MLRFAALLRLAALLRPGTLLRANLPLRDYPFHVLNAPVSKCTKSEAR